MIKLHHLENSRSLRILWLLEELGLDYDLVTSERDPETLLGPDSQTEVHPQGSWPVLEEEDGMVLAESGAITEYLIETTGAAGWKAAPGSKTYPDYLYWLHFAEGTLQPLSVMGLIFSELPKRAPMLVRPILKKAMAAVETSFLAPRAERALALVEEHLAKQDYFAGDHPTGADVMMIFALETALIRFDGLERYPHTTQYVRRIQGRPAYQRALEKGGRYDYAPL